MAWISSALRAAALAMGLATMGAGTALACDNCDTYDGYWHDGGHHDGYRDGRDGHDGYRDGRDGYRDGHDGYHDGRDGYRDDCRGDGCGRDGHDGCRDNCYRHEDGCRDGCGRRYSGCHSGCGGDNYSCRSGFYDCRFEGDCDECGFRERFYDRHEVWRAGGPYGFYGN